MSAWAPGAERPRIRNGTVVSVSGSRATVTVDGTQSISGVPVYGKVSAGQGVLVLEQGASLVVLAPGSDLSAAQADARYVKVLGGPFSARGSVISFAYDGQWHRANLTSFGSPNPVVFAPWGIGEPLCVSVVDGNPSNFGVGVWRPNGSYFAGPVNLAVWAVSAG